MSTKDKFKCNKCGEVSQFPKDYEGTIFCGNCGSVDDMDCYYWYDTVEGQKAIAEDIEKYGDASMIDPRAEE